MTDMIDRVACAICEKEYPGRWANLTSRTTQYPISASFSIFHYQDLARAAIEATFQVTDEDARAFLGIKQPYIDVGYLVDLDHGLTFYEAMQSLSSEALKEPEEVGG